MYIYYASAQCIQKEVICLSIVLMNRLVFVVQSDTSRVLPTDGEIYAGLHRLFGVIDANLCNFFLFYHLKRVHFVYMGALTLDVSSPVLMLYVM